MHSSDAQPAQARLKASWGDLPLSGVIMLCGQVSALGSYLRRATALPGGSHTACHDTIADTLLSICEEAGLEVRAEPSTIFARAIPAVDLIAARGQGGIIPDASVVVSLPAALTTPSDRPSRRRLPERRLLWDVKTIHGDTSWYRSARARDYQCGLGQTYVFFEVRAYFFISLFLPYFLGRKFIRTCGAASIIQSTICGVFIQISLFMLKIPFWRAAGEDN